MHKVGGVIYPFEMHLPGYSFAGPFTSLKDRLNDKDNPLPNSLPINAIDKISYYHDIMYRDYPTAKGRKVADEIMLNELDALDDKDLTLREKIDRRIVRPLIAARKFVGFGLPVSEQSALEMHHRIVRNFPRRKVIVNHIDDIWSADLVEIPLDQGYKYILTVIDVFSKYAWAIPLKNKQSLTVIDAFEKIIKDSGRTPIKLWTDAGSEFINKQFKKFLIDTKIELYHTFNEGKAVVIERFNRTLKEKMWFRFTVNGNKHWLNILPNLISEYNHSVHRTIRCTPVFASRKENEDRVRDNMTITNGNTTQPNLAYTKPKFKVGDLVRIYKYKGHFEKGYETNFTKEIFKIVKVLPTLPVTYKIEALDGEQIIGSFYSPELVKVNNI